MSFSEIMRKATATWMEVVVDEMPGLNMNAGLEGQNY